MANPQVENGYVKISTELLEAFAHYFPGNSEGQVLWAIIRKTYGWKKKSDKISISQLEDLTELSRRTVIYALQNLEAKKMIIIERKRGRGNINEINTIAFNKNYDKWVVQGKSQQYSKLLEKQRNKYKKDRQWVVQGNRGSAKNGKRVVQGMVKNSQILAPTIDTNTINTNNKYIYTSFDFFWNKYPRKIAKDKCLKKWQNIFKGKANSKAQILNEAIIIGLDKYINYWNDNNTEKEFIPHPLTWLNQARWKDDINVHDYDAQARQFIERHKNDKED